MERSECMRESRLNQRMKRVTIVGIVLLSVLIVYGIGCLYYRSHFLANTSIAGVSVSHQSDVKALERLNTQLPTTVLTMTEAGQEVANATGEQLGISVTNGSALTTALQQQNNFAWPLALFQSQVLEISFQSTDIQFNEAGLSQIVEQFSTGTTARQASVDAKIEETEQGWQLVPEVYGNELTVTSLKEGIQRVMGQPEFVLDISQAYDQPTVTANDATLQKQFAEIDAMQSAQITLLIDGYSVTIPKEEIASWLYFNEQGQAVADYDRVEDYVRELNYQYSGLLNSRVFQSTWQGEVVVQAGTYGWYIDRHTETPALIEDVENARTVTREPAIGGSGYGMGDSVGNSYVEVDIANQMMFIYLEGELVLETPIVTGRPGTDTIPGAYQVWNMETPSVLRGYNPHTDVNYEQPVSYWIAFDDQQQGIHDANWQASFGGASYTYSGSLGCVNTPPSVMPTVFSLVYYGMPVIIF